MFCLSRRSLRPLRFFTVLFLLPCLSHAGISASEYAARRSKLMAAHPDGLIVVHARVDRPDISEGGFRQEPNFYYLTGSDAFRAVLVLDAPKKESWLFGEGAAAGIEHTASESEFVPFVTRRLKEGLRRIYDTYAELPQHDLGKRLREELQRHFPRARFSTAGPTLAEMRWVKIPAEIEILRRVGWTTAAALRAGMRGIKAGRTQREVEAEVLASCVQNGAEGQSFWPWIMSGANAAYPAPLRGWFDYGFLNRTMQAGELVYLDLGCAAGHYEGDAGRTVPVSGKFTPEQREVWELLVRAYQAARAAIRPGSAVSDAENAYLGVWRAAQVKSDLGRAAVAAVLKQTRTGSEFLLHAVGLQPVERAQKGFRPGVVLALEPLVALPEQKMGFQVEDMLLVTETGTELLTGGLPYTADEVEEFLATSGRAAYTLVDSHNHLVPRAHTVEQLIRQMNVLGISRTIIFGGPRGDNENTLKAAAQHPDRLIPFYRPKVRVEEEAWLKNDPQVLAELERELSSGRYKGIGEFTNVHYPPGPKARMGEALLDTEVSPLAPMVISLFRLADRYRLPVLMHTEIYYHREFEQLLAQFPRVPVIWAHAGYASYYGVDMALKNHPNLYVDLSIRALYRPRDLREASIFHNETMLKPMWRDLIEKYPDRFMAGLDEESEEYRNHPFYVEWMGKLLSELRPSTARRVAVENIERLLAGR